MPAPIVSMEDRHLVKVREIFFESSLKKTFKDENEREAFFYKYLGFYLTHHPDLCFVYEDDKVLGYVVGAVDSKGEELLRIQPHLNVFQKYFKNYPAHLHINCHKDARGKGVGTKLVHEIEKRFREQGASGLHIMTGVDSANQSFYKKLGFDFAVKEDFGGSSILLMGKSL
ncbi:MAG: GNAT family N-acetyltransferase [Bacteriovoracia bacterium]